MPDVRVLTTSRFIDEIPTKAPFYHKIRTVVAGLFGFEVSVIAVQAEVYAPGCEDGRPAVTVAVSTNQKEERIAMHDELVEQLAVQVKSIVNEAIGRDIGQGQVKVRIDMVRRKIAIQ